jgi:hypothetical protein
MEDNFLLHERDMLKDTHFPVIAFFGVISNKSRYIPIIDRLSNGMGYGYNSVVCLFPEDVNLEDEKFGDGVEFSLDNGEAVVLSYKEFYWYLKKACDNYLMKYPEEKDTINYILEKVRMRYNITE